MAENGKAGSRPAPQSPDEMQKLIAAVIPKLHELKHSAVHCIMLDGIEPIPADVPKEEGPGVSRAAVYGRIMLSWHMSPEESPDGADYRTINYLPFKAWTGAKSRLCARMELAQDPRIAAFFHELGDVVVLRDGKTFARISEPNIDELYGKKRLPLDWRVFDVFSTEAEKDYNRLFAVLWLLMQPGTEAEVEKLLDKNFCPGRDGAL